MKVGQVRLKAGAELQLVRRPPCAHWPLVLQLGCARPPLSVSLPAPSSPLLLSPPLSIVIFSRSAKEYPLYGWYRRRSGRRLPTWRSTEPRSGPGILPLSLRTPASISLRLAAAASRRGSVIR